MATILSPRDVKPLTTSTPPSLSRSFSDTNISPDSGNVVPAANCDLANARAKESSIPITSPVERISGPSAVSTSAKRLNGNTASLTDTCEPETGFFNKPSLRSCSSVEPSMTRLATLARGTPVAFATKGTVRLARGFASIT
ncbi:unannotated protein [freshwater metagenome]|uniref:Unannotated protein n=1 Tax=freshwater metagenome TaxID=449393 RepID=A0A6J6GA67_9ZZZZ